jgi:hypothetical protein
MKIAGNRKTHYIPRKAFLLAGKSFENAWHLLR